MSDKFICSRKYTEFLTASVKCRLCRCQSILSAPEVIFNSYLLVSYVVYVRCLTSLSAPENILNSKLLVLNVVYPGV